MPRKRRDIPILRIQLMSTGKDYKPAPGLDDFTGLPIEPIVDTSPNKPLVDSWELQDAVNRQAREEKLALARALGIIPGKVVAEPVVVMVPPKVEGKRPYGKPIGGHATYVMLPPWRRDWS